MDDIHVRLDEPHFRQLVAGGVVEIDGADGRRMRIILADIGFELMQQALDDAINDAI